jgi:hypothetical protein
MSQKTILEIAAPNCVAQDFEGEIIALNLARGTYYSLRGLAAVLWRDLAAGHPVETLAALAADRLGGTQPVLDFVANATTHGLMQPVSNAATPLAEPRLVQALAGAGTAELVFEVFDDMNSLILLDPVHEVDEKRGWPNLPTSA